MGAAQEAAGALNLSKNHRNRAAGALNPSKSHRIRAAKVPRGHYLLAEPEPKR